MYTSDAVGLYAGRVQVKITSVHLKQEKLTLRMGKRHLRGAFITYEECKIFHFIHKFKPIENDILVVNPK